MKHSILTLFRTPIKTILWIIIIVLSCLLMTLCCSILLSSHAMADYVENTFTTIAVIVPNIESDIDEKSGVGIVSQQFLNPSQTNAICALPQVELVDRRKLVSVYSNSFNPLSSAETEHAYHSSFDKIYDYVLLTATILESNYYTEENYLGSSNYVCQGCIQIEDILISHPAYNLAVGDTLSFYWNEYYETDMSLLPGETYLVCGRYNASDLVYNPFLDRIGSSQKGSEPFLNISSELPLNTIYDPTTRTTHTTTREEVSSAEIPTFAKLDCTVEDFFSLESNELWKRSFSDFQISMHSLPALGTDCLESIVQFQQGSSTIIKGRSFTKQEYIEGTNVCIISEAIADRGEIGIGDTILISQYDSVSRDINGNVSVSISTSNPHILLHDSRRGFAQKDIEYQVVGIYRQEQWWDSESAYAFTPNTIFMPANSIVAHAFTARDGVFLSLKIQNGQIDEYLASCKEIELDQHVLCLDRGYDAAISVVKNIIDYAIILMFFALGCWFFILILFCAINFKKEYVNLGIIRSLGGRQQDALGYLLTIEMTIASIGVILGNSVAMLLLKTIRTKLFEAILSLENEHTIFSTQISFDTTALGLTKIAQTDIKWILLIMLIQFLIYFIIFTLQALSITRKAPIKLITRRE